MLHLEEILHKPLISEKTTDMSEKANRYGFWVALKANKYQIKMAVEKMFDVKIEDVKTTVVPGKVKRVGKSNKKLPSRKKAYVKVKEGQKIEFFKGI